MRKIFAHILSHGNRRGGGGVPEKKNCLNTDENEQIFPTLFLAFAGIEKLSDKTQCLFSREVQVTRDISILKFDMG